MSVTRKATEGATVTFVVNNEERTLEATKGRGGWTITATDEAEAHILSQFSDEAFTGTAEPTAEPESEAEDGQEGDTT